MQLKLVMEFKRIYLLKKFIVILLAVGFFTVMSMAACSTNKYKCVDLEKNPQALCLAIETCRKKLSIYPVISGDSSNAHLDPKYSKAEDVNETFKKCVSEELRE